MIDAINVHDFKTNYSKYLEQVVQGEEVIVSKRGKAVAKLVPLSHSKAPRQPGALKGKIWIADDFDKPMLELWDTLRDKK